MSHLNSFTATLLYYVSCPFFWPPGVDCVILASISFAEKYFFGFKILSHFWQRLVQEAGPSGREPVVVPPLDDAAPTIGNFYYGRLLH